MRRAPARACPPRRGQRARMRSTRGWSGARPAAGRRPSARSRSRHRWRDPSASSATPMTDPPHPPGRSPSRRKPRSERKRWSRRIASGRCSRHQSQWRRNDETRASWPVMSKRVSSERSIALPQPRGQRRAGIGRGEGGPERTAGAVQWHHRRPEARDDERVDRVAGNRGRHSGDERFRGRADRAGRELVHDAGRGHHRGRNTADGPDRPIPAPENGLDPRRSDVQGDHAHVTESEGDAEASGAPPRPVTSGGLSRSVHHRDHVLDRGADGHFASRPEHEAGASAGVDRLTRDLQDSRGRRAIQK